MGKLTFTQEMFLNGFTEGVTPCQILFPDKLSLTVGDGPKTISFGGICPNEKENTWTINSV